MWENIVDPDGNDFNSGVDAIWNLGGLRPNNYWTSSYYGNWNNWGIAYFIYHFGGGSFRPEIMSYHLYVRAVRDF